MVLWRPTRPSRTNMQKRCPIHHRTGKVRSQEIPGVTGTFILGVQNEAGQRLTDFPREHTAHSKHRLSTTCDDTSTSPDGQYWNQIGYILCTQRWKSSIQSAKTRPRVDYDSDHEFIAQFTLKLKKVGKTTRPFKYGLNQIPFDYTVEVTNRFKGLDLIHRVPEELWTEIHNMLQEVVIKTIPRKINAKRQNGCLRMPYK